MKKHPRWAATLVAATVILTSIVAPLEGTAAPGPIKLPDDPRYLFGDPDGPTSPMGIIFIVPTGQPLLIVGTVGDVWSVLKGLCAPVVDNHD